MPSSRKFGLICSINLRHRCAYISDHVASSFALEHEPDDLDERAPVLLLLGPVRPRNDLVRDRVEALHRQLVQQRADLAVHDLGRLGLCWLALLREAGRRPAVRGQLEGRNRLEVLLAGKRGRRAERTARARRRCTGPLLVALAAPLTPSAAAA